MSPNASATIFTPQQLLTHWQGHRGLTRKMIEAFPDDKLFTYSIGGMRPFSELAPAWHAGDTAFALCLAHFDEHLKESRDAKSFLDGDVKEVFQSRGITLEIEKKKETRA